MQKLIAAVLVALLALCGEAMAEEGCNLRFDVASADQWIVMGEGDACTVGRLASRSCIMSYGADHGWTGLHCGSGDYWTWGQNKSGFPEVGLAFLGAEGKVALPQHHDERRRWLAPIDLEGFRVTYPYDVRIYVDYYPRRFTRIGPKTAIENPHFSATRQTFVYRSMAGKARAAITGELAVGCLRLYFVNWADPARAAGREATLAGFLGEVRLEPVVEDSERRQRVCRSLERR